MFLNKKTNRLQYTYRIGQQVHTKTFPNTREGKKQAKAYKAEIELRKARGDPPQAVQQDGVYLDELAQLWVDMKKAQGRKQGWLGDWANIMNKEFLPVLGTRPAKSLAQSDIMAVITTKYANHSQSTRNRYISYLKSIFEFGVEQGMLDKNPLARWQKGKENRRRSALTLESLRTLKAASPPHLKWALEVLWNIPLRPGPSDLFALRFDRHFQRERDGFEVFHTKVGRWAFIHCTAAFLDAAAHRESLHPSGYVVEYQGRPVSTLKTALNSAVNRAGLPYHVCLYDVRHLWITTMLDARVEPSAIAYMSGTSVEMIHANYYEPHAAERVKASSVLPSL